MTVPAPWQCPQCLAWIAPHVTEHRCDRPEGVVKVTSIDPPGPPPLTFTGGGSSTATLPGTVTTINVTGGVASQQDLVREVQRSLLRYSAHSPRRTA